MCTVVTQDAFAVESGSPSQKEYLALLIQQSVEQRLAQKRSWQVLLHYRNDLFGAGVSSEVDGSEFFFSEDGKTDPVSELEATLAAFYFNKKVGKLGLMPQCAFPARYYWLNSRLDFDTALMPREQCPEIDSWREAINPSSVSLIFSSYYFNNPASMFGHTLLRFNSDEEAKPGLLDYAISYAAEIDEADGFFDYAWSGITGGFEGRFSVYPYYDMVKRYNDLENRDLWEYRLNLSPGQMDLMLLHAWELLPASFEFYFLQKNCSYHLLSLLEAADPALHLRDQYLMWTLPTETIKQVIAQPGLLQSVARRPSLGSMLEYRLDELSQSERRYVKELVDNPESVNSSEFDLLSPERKTLVIDAAINFVEYESYASRRAAGGRKVNLHALLMQRSKIQVSSNSSRDLDAQNPVSPHLGHDPVRLEISAGSFDLDEEATPPGEESFIEFSFRPGFHDLLSLEDGHAPNSQINFLDLRAHYGADTGDWQLQNFTLLDIISLYPLSSFIKKPSWKINMGWERNRDNACSDCTPFVLDAGIGFSFQSNLHRKEVYFAFAQASLEFDHEFESDHRGGFSASLGLLFDANEKWRIALIANRSRYTTGQAGYASEVELKQRFYLSREMEIILDLKTIEDYHEGKLGIAHYF